MGLGNDEGCVMCESLNPDRYKLCQVMRGSIGICGFENPRNRRSGQV